MIMIETVNPSGRPNEHPLYFAKLGSFHCCVSLSRNIERAYVSMKVVGFGFITIRIKISFSIRLKVVSKNEYEGTVFTSIEDLE